MPRSAPYLVGGFVVLLSAATFAPMIDGHLFAARSESFDARWAEFASTAKQDRLAPPRPRQNIQVVSVTDPQNSTTTLNKVENAALRPQRSPVRELPRDSVEKEKLPVGCEPSFSPVAAPSMANVTGRCLAERSTGRKVADLTR